MKVREVTFTEIRWAPDLVAYLLDMKIAIQPVWYRQPVGELLRSREDLISFSKEYSIPLYCYHNWR